MLKTCVIPDFHGILTGKSIYSIIFVIEGQIQSYLQGLLQGHRYKKKDFQQTQIKEV